MGLKNTLHSNIYSKGNRLPFLSYRKLVRRRLIHSHKMEEFRLHKWNREIVGDLSYSVLSSSQIEIGEDDI